mmetsp:Transcript_26424/g.29444  ORF Transcript_26424/g.29444 Transcript_26424/m.29444 type:complete len:628 (+) Transcript_26424:72-1955(+)
MATKILKQLRRSNSKHRRCSKCMHKNPSGWKYCSTCGLKNPTNAQHLFRLAIMGSAGTGKSCLVLRYIGGHFYSKVEPTIEDTYSKQTEHRGIQVMVEIIDTAGPTFSAMRELYMKFGQGFILVFSVTSRQSLEDLEQIQRDIKKRKPKDQQSAVPMVLVGAKCDLDKSREVSFREGLTQALEWGCPYLEISAKLDLNINSVFQSCLDQLFAKNKIRMSKDESSFYIYKKPCYLEIPGPPHPPKFKSKSSLLIKDVNKVIQHLEDFRVFSDFTLETKDCSLPLHKIFLARSNHLSEYAQKHDSKKVQGPHDLVFDLMSFIYTSILPINPGSGHSLNQVFNVAVSLGIGNLVRAELGAGCTGRLDPIHRVQMSSHFELYFNSKTFSDVKFYVGSSKKPLYAHRVILASRCNYFKAMFSQPLKESHSFDVHIGATTRIVFYHLIRYLYTDKIEFTKSLDKFDHLQGLLMLAGQYGIRRLQKRCEQRITKYVKVDNAIELLSLGEATVSKYLVSYCTWVLQKEFLILSKSCDLLTLSPRLRNKALVYSKYHVAEKHQSKWALLKPEILGSIFRHLPFYALKNARSVCSYWHYASYTHMPKMTRLRQLSLGCKNTYSKRIDRRQMLSQSLA